MLLAGGGQTGAAVLESFWSAAAATGPASTSELAQPFGMTLPSFTQHLALLEGANLVTSIKQGRIRTYRLAPRGLDAAEGWLADQRRSWDQRLDQLDQFLIKQKEST